MANNDAALAAFMARKAELDALLQRLQSASDNHLGLNPEWINWSDAGSMGAAVDQLRNVAEFLNA